MAAPGRASDWPSTWQPHPTSSRGTGYGNHYAPKTFHTREQVLLEKSQLDLIIINNRIHCIFVLAGVYAKPIKGRTSDMPTATRTRDHQLDDEFHRLLEKLSSLLADSPGSSFTDIDPGPLVKLMEDYRSEHKDWSGYAYWNRNQSFTRNLVDRGNGKHNALILVWSPGKESPVHDHAGSHCIMKMLQGSLKETQYGWPNKELLEAGNASPLESQGAITLSQDEVTYIADSHGLHKIENQHPTDFAVSLHLYTPANAARHGCQVFDETTGNATHVVQYDLFSEMGQVNCTLDKAHR